MISTLRVAALVTYFALFALVVAWLAWLEPPGSMPRSLALVLFAGPLLLPLRGLLHARPFTHAWASFLVLFYFMHGVGEAYSRSASFLPVAEIVLSITFYATALFFARLRSREVGQGRPQQPSKP